MEKDLLSKLDSFVFYFYEPTATDATWPGAAPEERLDISAKMPSGTMARKKPPEEPQEKPEAPAVAMPTEEPETRPRMMSMRMASYRMPGDEESDFEKWKAAKEKWLAEQEEKRREEREGRRSERRGPLLQRPIASDSVRRMEAAAMDLDLPPLEQSFRDRLFALIQEKELDEVDVYKCLYNESYYVAKYLI